MTADLGTLARLINAGTTLRQLIGNSVGNRTAFEDRLRTMVSPEFGELLRALDSVMQNTRVLELAEIKLSTPER